MAAAEDLARRFSSSTTISVTREEFFAALKAQTQTIRSNSGVELTEELFATCMPSLKEVAITVAVKDNLYTLTTGSETVKSVQYGPAGNTAAPGSYYTSEELRALANDEFKSPSVVFADLKGKVSALTLLEYSYSQLDVEILMNNLELTVISENFANDPASYSALLVIGKEFEEGIKHWISCVIKKSKDAIQLIITDPANKDRLHDATIQQVKQAVKDGLLKKVTLPKKDNSAVGDMFALGGPAKKKDEKANEEVVNYDAPLAHIPLTELPTLEDLFGGKIPNNVQVLLKQLERRELDKSPMSARLKNCFILYGPPGTGKSTIAQRMARMAGRNVVYAGGGDFRTAYQGSGKAKLDALFNEAKKRGFCVVIIDEIDGASSKLQPNGSTQEDNRAIKALITTLDQHRHDPDIFVICTTNYPDKIDPAILRRFTSIEIPLPQYENRRRIFDNFLQQLDIPIETGNNHAVTPGFYDKLISATEGFSGDKIIDMLVNAKYECDAGLPAESSIGFGWRLKGINLTNKSILANLGEFALLPFAPLFHIIPDSEMDKHLYNQYIRHMKLIDDLEELEWKNDPRNLNHKYGWYRYFKIMGQEGFKSIVHGVFTGIGTSIVNTALTMGRNVDYQAMIRAMAPRAGAHRPVEVGADNLAIGHEDHQHGAEEAADHHDEGL
jgi:hypothetical protein